MTKEMIANTSRQSLSLHLLAVARLAKEIARRKTDNTNIHNCAFIAGLIHDIGKVDPEYQKWAKKGKVQFHDNGQHIETGKFTFEKHARHNEISVFVLSALIGVDRSSKKKFLQNNGFKSHSVEFIDMIYHAVYWHHAKPLRKKGFDKMEAVIKNGPGDHEKLILESKSIIQECGSLGDKSESLVWTETGYSLDETIEDVGKMQMPAYKRYSTNHSDLDDYTQDIHYNSFCNIVRSSVICADQIISSLSACELDNFIKNGSPSKLLNRTRPLDSLLLDAAENHSKYFFPDSKRTVRQKLVAKDLALQAPISALCGPAGCGKTKIAVEWARIKSATKLYWIVPRISVGQGIYQELTSGDYLPGCRVEIFTGDIKLTKYKGVEAVTTERKYLSGDVIITTIDQLVNSITTHKGVSIYTDFMMSHAVFDEFHEFASMNAMNLLFAEILRSKANDSMNSSALLVSATPNYLYCEKVLGVSPSDFVEMETSNKSNYKISFESFHDGTEDADHPLVRPVDPGTIVISNTASMAQSSFLKNLGEPDAILFHSRLASLDKEELFSEVFESFKKDGTRKYKVLRSSPITQASLNITCSNMITEATSPENTLQRLGRLDRFGESDEVNELTIALPESLKVNKIIDKEGRFLNSMNVFHTCYAWYDFLKSKDLEITTLSNLYALYKSFYGNDGYIKKMTSDLKRSLLESAKTINLKVVDPVWIKPKTIEKQLLKKTSIRGDSRYVQMARAFFDKGDFEVQDQYAFDDQNKMTLSVSELDGEDSPLSFMSKKHHQITGEGSKHSNGRESLIGRARDIEQPIYTSYTPSDLIKVNEASIPSSIVYVFTSKQVIGSMRIDKLKTITGE